ncbi:unnamed protein product [Medioppia subpectinata]|uniref:Uncharacterized protein n=1 Tax=Medioppia subpectinata TaxID=1979941 RepID=A0A7R9Q7G9_9ACAR|nr:unnamed protein product [Medioppia subpectinata]CAG2114292.1 unnamed protein product [Medioppia subpectinata]
MKVMALKTTNNINTLVRELFKIPPSFKSSITLSWKPPVSKAAITAKPLTVVTSPTVTTSTTTTAAATAATPADGATDATAKPSKRQPITAPEGSSDPKKDRKIYAPPSGKFSGGVKRFNNNNDNNNGTRGSFRGGNRGGFRGGRGGRGYNRGFKRW